MRPLTLALAALTLVAPMVAGAASAAVLVDVSLDGPDAVLLPVLGNRTLWMNVTNPDARGWSGTLAVSSETRSLFEDEIDVPPNGSRSVPVAARWSDGDGHALLVEARGRGDGSADFQRSIPVVPVAPIDVSWVEPAPGPGPLPYLSPFTPILDLTNLADDALDVTTARIVAAGRSNDTLAETAIGVLEPGASRRVTFPEVSPADVSRLSVGGRATASVPLTFIVTLHGPDLGETDGQLGASFVVQDGRAIGAQASVMKREFVFGSVVQFRGSNPIVPGEVHRSDVWVANYRDGGPTSGFIEFIAHPEPPVDLGEPSTVRRYQPFRLGPNEATELSFEFVPHANAPYRLHARMVGVATGRWTSTVAEPAHHPDVTLTNVAVPEGPIQIGSVFPVSVTLVPGSGVAGTVSLSPAVVGGDAWDVKGFAGVLDASDVFEVSPERVQLTGHGREVTLHFNVTARASGSYNVVPVLATQAGTTPLIASAGDPAAVGVHPGGAAWQSLLPAAGSLLVAAGVLTMRRRGRSD